ncbi:hypothetical protein Bca4012_028155 [Brassica carinata]|uniref:Uncharacterized protein n=1 Tax=Brassica carinata TaxID=52824 RepID=A0A8X7VLP9_BRACI|nr:hypothetical protein Bca52824_025182 [Brassica carinata]
MIHPRNRVDEDGDNKRRKKRKVESKNSETCSEGNITPRVYASRGSSVRDKMRKNQKRRSLFIAEA